LVCQKVQVKQPLPKNFCQYQLPLWPYRMKFQKSQSLHGVCVDKFLFSVLRPKQKIIILLSRLSPYIDEIIGDHQCQFRCRVLIVSYAFGSYWRKSGSTMRHYISYTWTSRKRVIQLGGKYCTIFS
jgi:hypothetical protein